MTQRDEYTPEMRAAAVRVMASNLAEQLGEHLDRFLDHGMNYDDGRNLREWLWHNKVGILRSLQSCSAGESQAKPDLVYKFGQPTEEEAKRNRANDEQTSGGKDGA